jgi:hypothetical protein
VPLPCHISTDALLRIGRNTAETGHRVAVTFGAVIDGEYSQRECR